MSHKCHEKFKYYKKIKPKIFPIIEAFGNIF